MGPARLCFGKDADKQTGGFNEVGVPEGVGIVGQAKKVASEEILQDFVCARDVLSSGRRIVDKAA